MGIPVQADAATHSEPAPGAGLGPAATIETGGFVTVSGYWRPDGTMDARRIAQLAPRESVSVAGRVMETTRRTVTVGGAKVDLAGTAVLSEEARGHSLLPKGDRGGQGSWPPGPRSTRHTVLRVRASSAWRAISGQ
jgi:hypothetical protein